MQTIESEEFGRHFFIDIGFHFISAPSLKDGGYDESQLDYVSNWSDWEGVDMDKLFDINRKTMLESMARGQRQRHTQKCVNFMEALETGEIHFL